VPEPAVTNSTLEAMGPWLHDFVLPEPLRIPIDPELRRRIRQRHDLIVPRILDQFPGRSLANLSALDLGANSGYWGRAIASFGAAVTCVEPRSENIAQAQLVSRLLGDAGMAWIQDSAEAFLSRRARRFDVVLCLGLLYHAADAIALLNAAASSCNELLVVDSHCINDDVPYLEMRQELHTHPSQGVSPGVTVPSRGAVYRMLKAAGFAHVMELANVGDLPDDYRTFTRCAFFARRTGAVQPPSGPNGRLFLRDEALDRIYPPMGHAGALNRTESRPRCADFYEQLTMGADR
jgi:SAM-dependent methyltransferase